MNMIVIDTSVNKSWFMINTTLRLMDVNPANPTVLVRKEKAIGLLVGRFSQGSVSIDPWGFHVLYDIPFPGKDSLQLTLEETEDMFHTILRFQNSIEKQAKSAGTTMAENAVLSAIAFAIETCVVQFVYNGVVMPIERISTTLWQIAEENKKRLDTLYG